MKCPKDGFEMEGIVVDSVPLDVCTHCGGVWLDWGELRQVTSDLVTEYELIYRGSSERSCPKCDKQMNTSDLQSVIVEECKCGIFFDKGEAKKILGKNIDLKSKKTYTLKRHHLEKLLSEKKLKIADIRILLED